MSARPVGKEQEVFFNALREQKIISKVVPLHFDLRGGVIVVACGDGDHFVDIMWHLLTIYLQSHFRWVCYFPLKLFLFFPFVLWWLLSLRTHMLVLNGGACLLSPNWPRETAQVDIGLVLEDQVRVATGLKGIWQVFLYGHAPCGAAGSMKGCEQIAHLMDAKERIKNLDARYKVACFMHLCLDSPRKIGGFWRRLLRLRRRTYFFSREAWLKNGSQLRERL